MCFLKNISSQKKTKKYSAANLKSFLKVIFFFAKLFSQSLVSSLELMTNIWSTRKWKFNIKDQKKDF